MLQAAQAGFYGQESSWRVKLAVSANDEGGRGLGTFRRAMIEDAECHERFQTVDSSRGFAKDGYVGTRLRWFPWWTHLTHGSALKRPLCHLPRSRSESGSGTPDGWIQTTIRKV